MKPYTVVGVYLDTYQRYVEHVQALSPHGAKITAEMAADECLIVVEVFEGHLMGLLPEAYVTRVAR